MSQSLIERRRVILDAIAEVEKRFAENESLLKQAPLWFTPGMDAANVPEGQRSTFKQLRRAASSLSDDRSELDQLKAELVEVERKIADLNRCVLGALNWINGLTSAIQFQDEIVLDPLISPTDGRTPPPLKVAKRILSLRDKQHGGRITSLDILRTINGVNDALIADIIRTGCQPSRPTVGVLLPVRLETRFYAPTGGTNWKLRVRIIPDEPSIDRFDPAASTFELDSVESLWREVSGDLKGDTPEKKAEWKRFTEKHGGPRAAWLARKFPAVAGSNPIRIERPSQTRTETRFSQVSGFPTAIELWMGRGGAPAHRVAQTTVKQDQLLLDFANPTVAGDKRWWSSWDTAVDVGLGVEIDLGPAVPDNIDVLYAIGLGTASPVGLFQAHRDAGTMAVLAPGTPTNTVSGEPAADLGKDPETWRKVSLPANSLGAGIQQLSRGITGNPSALEPLPGSTLFDRLTSQTMMRLLWPVLWQPVLAGTWGFGQKMIEVGEWAAKYVLPEGPLPPIRIGNQPYGLLPTTSLEDWEPSPNDPDFEEAIRPYLIKVRKFWASTALGTGNIYRANTDLLLQLIGRNAGSTTYACRFFMSLEMLGLIYWSFDGGISRKELEKWWDDTGVGVLSLLNNPKRKYATLGWPRDLKVPLITPNALPSNTTLGGLIVNMVNNRSMPFDPAVPKSLLVTLIQLALIRTSALLYLATEEDDPLLKLEPVFSQLLRSELESYARGFNTSGFPISNPFGINPAVEKLYSGVRDAAKNIAPVPVEILERLLLATLDTASYRIDPWITAYAWRRLDSYDETNSRWQLGIYGWVDSPRPGNPGPTAGGFIHAPSEAQAITAAILRDKAINDPEAQRWQMNLESDTIRLADQIAEEVRLGSHINEVLGREIERAVGVTTTIDQLRKQFPLRPEHDGRRVCDGDAILRGEANPTLLNPGQRTALGLLTISNQNHCKKLRRALDAYGDLLIVEATYHVVNGCAEVAGAVMDAAVGLSRPPNLKAIESPIMGRNVSTSVLVAIPTSDPPPPSQRTFKMSPGLIADPAVAQFLIDTLGPSNQPPWRWRVELSDGTTRDLFLTEIGLAPIDTVMLSTGELSRLILMVPDVKKIVNTAVIAGFEVQRSAKQIVNMLGNRPALPEDLLNIGVQLDHAASLNDEVTRELEDRYTALQTLGKTLLDKLSEALPTGSDERAAALRERFTAAARWGITPLTRINEGLEEMVARARQALEDRLTSQGASLPSNASAQTIASFIAKLAAPEGRVAVLSRIALSGIPTTFDIDRTLDRNWLSVVAAVRPRLAVLEIFQMEALLNGTRPALLAKTNFSGDPWQTRVAAGPDGAVPSTRFVALYGSRGAIRSAPSQRIAMTLLDSWTETVPDQKHATTVVFGFNAPKARAPQAILLAVPPKENEPLTTPVLVDVLSETRELARARMASPNELYAYSAVLPFAMLPLFKGIPVDL